MAFGRDPPVIFRVGGWLWPRPACFFWAGGGPGGFSFGCGSAGAPHPTSHCVVALILAFFCFAFGLRCSAPGPVGIFSLFFAFRCQRLGDGGPSSFGLLVPNCRVTADPDIRKAGGHDVRCGAQLGHIGGGLGSVIWESVRLAGALLGASSSRRPVGQFPSI